MAWRKCTVTDCQHWLREGLRRYGSGVDGQELADGITCWRCRAKQAAAEKRAKKMDAQRKDER